MVKRLETVRYDNPETSRAYYIHRLNTPVSNLYGASRVLELLQRSYTDRFESPEFRGPTGPLSPGTMRQRFTGAPDANVRQMNQMNRTIAHGSSYWYVNPSETSPTDLAFKFNENESVGGYVAGLIKTSPSRPTVAQRLHLQTPNCYVNDIIVDPALKRNAASPTNHYIGSMLMHAALNFGDFKPGASLAIDGYAGNDAANAWFDRLGLREDSTAELAGWAASDTITLPQVHYMSQPGQTLRRHVEALERVAPWLGNASLIVTT